MKKINIKSIIRMLFVDIIAGLLLGISVDVFLVNGDFAPGGVTGLSVIANYLFNIPIGLAIILVNIPIIFFTYKKLGNKFFLRSLMSIIICSIFIDYVICYLPSYHGHNVVIAILSGICAGIGYSILFNNNSSTGGTDFIIVALKKWKKNLSFGLIAFLIDGIIIVLSVFIFKKFEAFLYGLLYTITTSIFIDLMSGIIKEVKNKKI